jgi:hypothetical protein
MKKQVRWSARELLMRNGFDDGNFAIKYSRRSGSMVSPTECLGCSTEMLGRGSFVSGDDYPDYVRCLVDLLHGRGLRYIVLQDPEVGSHNVDTIESFVWSDVLYVVAPRDCHWFAKMPYALQNIFQETFVTVQVEEIDDSSR